MNSTLWKIRCNLNPKAQAHQQLVVNVVLLKLCPEVYQSRYNLSPIRFKQDTIHTATLP